MASKPSSDWLVPVLLLIHGALTVVLGAVQMLSIQNGPAADGSLSDFTATHYFTMPLPILVHIATGILFSLLAPFQFARPIRQRWPRIHRLSGRVLVLAGFAFALTALWMNQYFPAFGGAIKYIAIMVFSIGIMASFVIALLAIRKNNIPRHRAWMMRAMAIGLGGATQRVFFIPAFIILGELSPLTIALGVWAGFLVNLAVVEWVLRSERLVRTQKTRFLLPA